jgi:uncharacterized membrane protein YgcG
MDYIRLTNLTNTYPKPGNYIPYLYGDGALFGVYADVNKIDFKFTDFSEVIPIKGISTKYIFAVTYDKFLSDTIDEDENVVESKLDINNLQKSVNTPTDTVLDKFIKKSDSSKRKKKKGLFGKIARIAGVVAVTAFAPGLLTVGGIATALNRNKKRKQERATKSLAERENSEELETKPSRPTPLGVTKNKNLNKLIGTRNERRNRIFGNNTSSLENSTSLTKKPDLISDNNKIKPRIFSDLKISNKESVETKLFCSQDYLDNLTDAKRSANVYFVNFSFKPEFVVEINSIALLQIMDSYLDAELENGVLMKRNNYLVDGSIDFDKLLTYVDWVLSKPKLSEIDTDGVIPANLLCEYERGTFDKKTGKWDVSVIQKSNTTVTETNPVETNNSTFPPVGRAGTYTGEIIDLNGEFYVWTGTIWRPTRPDNRNNTGAGGRNSGGGNSGGGNSGGGYGRRGQL